MELDIGLLTKVTSCAAAGLMMLIAVWSFFQLGKAGGFMATFEEILMSINLIILSLVLALSEMGTDFIHRGFYLVAQLFGRGLFVAFLGLWLLAYKSVYTDTPILEKLCEGVGISLLIMGPLYIFAYFLFPNKNVSAPAK